jgi:hypothetical protein
MLGSVPIPSYRNFTGLSIAFKEKINGLNIKRGGLRLLFIGKLNAIKDQRGNGNK